MAIANTDIEAYSQRVIGNRVGSRIDAIIHDCINKAVQRITMDLNSDRNIDYGSISLVAAYTTGTIAISTDSATVTLTGGTFPTWSASGEIMIDGQFYDIASRDSDTQLTLSSAWVESAITAGSYAVFQDAYALPDNCMAVGDNLVFGDDWMYGSEPSSFQDIMNAKQFITDGNDYPYMFAVANRNLYVWPYPTEAHTFHYAYSVLPAKVAAFGTSVDLPIDDAHENLLKAAVKVELAGYGSLTIPGNPQAEYMQELRLANKYTGSPKGRRSMRNGPTYHEQPRVSGMQFNWPS